MGAAGLYLNDISTPRNRARTTAPLMVASLVGFSMGPALGGFLAEVHSLQAPFFVCSFGMACAAACAAVLLPETRRVTAEVQEPAWRQWSRLATRPSLQGITAVVGFQGFSQGSWPVTTILVASEQLALGPVLIGALFTANVVTMAAAMPFITRLSDRTPNRLWLIVPGVLVHCLAVALQSLCITPEPFFALGVCGALGSAFVMPNVSAFVIDNTRPQERAQALALRNMAQDVGMLIGACTMGFVSAAFGAPFAMQVVAGLHGSAAIFCAIRGGLRPFKRA